MSIKINLPDIGIDEVEVTEILVKVGDKIDVEQLLITVEGEKALMEVVSPFSGKVKEIKISKGDKIKTGSLIMIFSIDSNKKSKVSDKKILNNHKKENIINIDKLQNISSKEKNNFSKIKNDFLKYQKNVYASPLIRRLARQYNINLSKITGTGLKNRILYEDLCKYIQESVYFLEKKSKNFFENINVAPWPKIDFSKFGKIKEIKLTHIQRKSSENLIRNWSKIPHVTIMEDIDITELESFRKTQNFKMKKLNINIKITILVIVIKVVSHVLKEMPIFNSSISEDMNKIILKNYINIGIAVDTPKALFIPVIREVNKKGIVEIAKELKILSKKARNGELSLKDMQGSSFTISSLGNIGTTNFTPIVNVPEVAIIGISKSSVKPVWNGDKFIPRLILPISLAFDHRIINGADGARFVNRISELISDIRLLIM